MGTAIAVSTIILFIVVNQNTDAESFRLTDLNQDGVVDQGDITIYEEAVAIQDTSVADLNGDDVVDVFDLFIINKDYGTGDSENRDFDKDGFSVADGDCDDNDATVFPFAEELADGIDNNCNTLADELLDYEPIASNEYYSVNVHFEENGSKNNLSVASVESGDYGFETTGLRNAGPYGIVLRNANDEIIDVVSFGIQKDITAYLYDEITEDAYEEEKHLTSGDVAVEIPKVAEIASATLVEFADDSIEIPINLNDAASGISAADTGSSSTTQADAFQACVNAGLNDGDNQVESYEVLTCYGFDNPDLTSKRDEFVSTFKDFKNTQTNVPTYSLFELVHVPLKSVHILTKDEFYAKCTSYVAGGCHIQNNLYLRAQTTPQSPRTFNQFTIAHELAHKWQWALEQLGGMIATTPGNAQAASYANAEPTSLAGIINSKCSPDDQACFFNPSKFNEKWPSRQSCADGDLSGLNTCGAGGDYKWKGSLLPNPISGNDDPKGPRPNNPGVIKSYAAKNVRERFATLFEAKLATRLQTASSLCKIIPDYRNEGGIGGLTNDTALMSSTIGFITDENDNGIPDECDPKTAKVICANNFARASYCSTGSDPQRKAECERRTKYISAEPGSQFATCGVGLITGYMDSSLPMSKLLEIGCEPTQIGGDSSPSCIFPGPPAGDGPWYRRVASICGPTHASFIMPGACSYDGIDENGEEITIPYNGGGKSYPIGEFDTTPQF